MNWKEKMQSARQAGEQKLDEKTHKAIEENWPKVQELFREKVGPAALAAAHDDEKMKTLFEFVYAALPFPVHVAVKEDAFVKFCFARRDRLMPSDEPSAGLAEWPTSYPGEGGCLEPSPNLPDVNSGQLP